ncbi:MAG: hypothetical protein K8W52_34055 [Deltaproteobacteria bacterium]|nr:hypothetical protein [Deltaproteobacteria bacterium]
MNAIRSSLLAVTGALALLATPAIAHADGRAWAAVEKRLPNDVYVVLGTNLGAMRGSALFKSLPALVAEDRDATEVTKGVKKYCKKDIYASIDDAVIALSNTPNSDDNGVIVVAFKGVDQATFDGCMRKFAKGAEKVTITTAQLGEITEYTAVGETDKLYIAWLAKDVIAVATDANDKAKLVRFLGGKGVSPALAAAIGKTNTAGVAWGAMAQDTPVGGMTIKTIVGALTFARSKFALEAHVGLASAAEATTFAAGAKQELTGMMARVPKPMQALLSAINITAIGAEAQITTTIPDQKSSDLMKLFDKIF